MIGGSDQGAVYVVPIGSPEKTQVLDHVAQMWYSAKSKGKSPNLAPRLTMVQTKR